MTRRGIQHRVEVPKGQLCITEFTLDGVHYTIAGVSKARDLMPTSFPIGVFLTGCAKQYTAKTDDKKAYEVYIYYYRSCEGTNYAVIDAIREAF